MQVILAKNWFTGAQYGRFRKSLTKKGPPVEIPDALREHLPSSARIVGEEYVAPEPEPVGPETLSEAAALLGINTAQVAGEMAAKVVEKANADHEAARKPRGRPRKSKPLRTL